MAKATSYIPEGVHTVTPYLTVKDARKALEFYREAFEAEVTLIMPMPDGRLAHAEFKIGDSHVFMADEFPEWGSNPSPATVGSSTVTLHMYVPDVDKAYERAVRAGCKAQMAPSDMFWGDRFSKVVDPFGHHWALATQLETLTPAEIEERQKAWMASMVGQ